MQYVIMFTYNESAISNPSYEKFIINFEEFKTGDEFQFPFIDCKEVWRNDLTKEQIQFLYKVCSDIIWTFFDGDSGISVKVYKINNNEISYRFVNVPCVRENPFVLVL